MANSNLNEIIDTSLSRIKELANSQTVIGDPITLPNGTTIVPVCKVAIGYATGGLDFPAKGNAPTATKFGGGGGSGITVTPIAFLTVSATGTTELLEIHTPAEADSLDKITALIEKSPDILERIKNVFASKKKPTGDADTSTEG